MADEQPGEEEMKKEEVAGLQGEEFEEPQEEFLQGEEKGEASYTSSLVSDLCREERELGEEGEQEEEGEGYRVCAEMEAEGEGRGRYKYPEAFEEEELEEEEAFDVTLEERRTLDSQYLKSVLGTPLTFALLDIAMKRPTDPIQYLGSYLLKWRWTNIEKQQYESQKKELDEEREAYKEKLRERERQLMLEKEEREEEFRRGERIESTIEDDDEEEVEGHELGVEV